MNKVALIILGGIALTATAQAASFDCSKAATTVEMLICSNTSLSKLDEGLRKLYTYALQDKSQSNAIKQSEVQWIKERNDCVDFSCIRDKYLTRAIQLNSIVKAMNDKAISSPKQVMTDVAEIFDCNTSSEKVKAYARQGNMIFSSDNPSDEIMSIAKLFHESKIMIGDLDNDGIDDLVVFATEQTNDAVWASEHPYDGLANIIYIFKGKSGGGYEELAKSSNIEYSKTDIEIKKHSLCISAFSNTLMENYREIYQIY